MPTYGYECKSCKEQFETFQRITEDPLKVHEGCGGELRRLLYPVGIVFKGDGFYVNDYNTSKKEAAKAEASAANGSSSPKSESKAEGKTETTSETKTESKTETKVDAKPMTAATGTTSAEKS